MYTATADLVQLGNDFLIVLSGGCQLCQVDLLLPFLLVLHLSHDFTVTQKTCSWLLSTVMNCYANNIKVPAALLNWD